VELEHFLVLDAVVAPKVHWQVIDRDGLAAGEEATLTFGRQLAQRAATV
jgi:hypothetical protein